jgi:hypothetical protein
MNDVTRRFLKTTPRPIGLNTIDLKIYHPQNYDFKVISIPVFRKVFQN